jgi:hypothetical protein
LAIPSIPARATSAADAQAKDGPISSWLFLKPAASMNSVATGPGQSAVIVTPVFLSSSDTDSLKLSTNDFVAA